jgi:hypothetical protein
MVTCAVFHTLKARQGNSTLTFTEHYIETPIDTDHPPYSVIKKAKELARRGQPALISVVVVSAIRVSDESPMAIDRTEFIKSYRLS